MAGSLVVRERRSPSLSPSLSLAPHGQKLIVNNIIITIVVTVVVVLTNAAVASSKTHERPQPRTGVVVNTWPFTEATAAAFATLRGGGSHVDAVVEGCSRCESLQCDGSVGFGGSPDEAGETTLDAMVMDAETMNVGSVGALRNVKGAARAARLVLDYTTQTLIVGEQASRFAVGLGMQSESLETPHSMAIFENWRANSCQPNYWADPRSSLTPDPKSSCGPYSLVTSDGVSGISGVDGDSRVTPNLRDDDFRDARVRPAITEENHDTIGMVVIDGEGRIAAGTSTNGASHKVPGRVGDSPIAGAGAYATVHGGCASTGDGDVMMRFLPCYQAVERYVHCIAGGWEVVGVLMWMAIWPLP